MNLGKVQEIEDYWDSLAPMAYKVRQARLTKYYGLWPEELHQARSSICKRGRNEPSGQLTLPGMGQDENNDPQSHNMS